MAVTTKLDVLYEVLSLDYFRDETLTKRAKEQGYSYFTCGYIHNIILCVINDNEVDIKAKCYRSMRKNETPHTVNVTVRKDQKIISDSRCTCVAGLSGTCSHVVGLVYTITHYQNLNLKEVPAELSATSLPQQWHKPRGRKIKAQSVSSMTLANPTKAPSQRKRKPVFTSIQEDDDIPTSTIEDIKKLKEDPQIPVSYLLQENAQQIQSRLGNVQTGSLLYFHLQHYEGIPSSSSAPVQTSTCGNTDFPIMDNVHIFELEEEFKTLNDINPITHDLSMKLEKNTFRQVNSEEWVKQRKYRITASRFSKIVKRRKEIDEKFVSSIMNPKPFKSAATSYGIANETTAKEVYAQNFRENHLHDCGLVVNPNYSFLGATPDGKICANSITGIIEIKCPFAVRDLTIEEAIEKDNFCLRKNEINEIVMNKNHDYYCQVQGQLFITGAPFCEFIVYTKKDLVAVRVFPNTDFQKKMFLDLCNFYKTHAVPFINNLRSSSV